MLIYIIFVVVAILVIFLDQLTKVLVVDGNVDSVLIPELLKFSPCHNQGAAFSFLSGKSWAQTFFIILTFIACAAVIGWVVYMAIQKFKNGKQQSNWLTISLSLILGGAIGNLIDRIAFREVRDFINVFYNTRIFPAVFNVADIALVVGVIMILVYLLFLDKDALFKIRKKD